MTEDTRFEKRITTFQYMAKRLHPNLGDLKLSGIVVDSAYMATWILLAKKEGKAA